MPDDAGIKWEVNSTLSFNGQMVIRTEGGADILFNLEMKNLVAIVREIAPHGWQKMKAP